MSSDVKLQQQITLCTVCLSFLASRAPKVKLFSRSSNKELTAPLGVESVVLADVFSSLGVVLEHGHGHRDDVDSPERQILCMPCARSLITVRVKLNKLTRNLACQRKENEENAEPEVLQPLASPPGSSSKRFLDPGHHSGFSPAAKQVKQPLSTQNSIAKNANPRKLAFDELHTEKPKSSTVQAVISYPDGSIKRLTTEGKSSTMIRCLAYKNPTGFSKAAMSVPSLKEAIVGSVCQILQKEVSTYKKSENLLEVKKNTKPSEISDFELSKFYAELNEKMPVTMKLVESLTSKVKVKTKKETEKSTEQTKKEKVRENSMCSIVSICLHQCYPNLSKLHHRNTLMLINGGCRSLDVGRMQGQGLLMSHKAAIRMQTRMTKNHNSKVLAWKDDIKRKEMMLLLMKQLSDAYEIRELCGIPIDVVALKSYSEELWKDCRTFLMHVHPNFADDILGQLSPEIIDDCTSALIKSIKDFG